MPCLAHVDASSPADRTPACGQHQRLGSGSPSKGRRIGTPAAPASRIPGARLTSEAGMLLSGLKMKICAPAACGSDPAIAERHSAVDRSVLTVPASGRCYHGRSQAPARPASQPRRAGDKAGKLKKESRNVIYIQRVGYCVRHGPELSAHPAGSRDAFGWAANHLHSPTSAAVHGRKSAAVYCRWR